LAISQDTPGQTARGAAARGQTWFHVAVLALVFVGGTLFFWNLRPQHREGGDTGEMAIWMRMNGPTYYYRSPATVFVHQVIYWTLEPFGWTPFDAMALSSCLSGGLFLAALLMISRHPLFLFVNLCCPAIMLFAGHEEDYDFVNALQVLFFACGQRVWQYSGDPARRDPLACGRWAWAASIVFVSACLAHMLTCFYLPALAMLAVGFRREKGRWAWRRPIADRALAPYLIPSIVFLVFIAVAPVIVSLFGRVAGQDNNLIRFVPVFPTTDKRYFFTIFSLAHFKFLWFIHLNSAPLALPLIVALVWRYGRDPFCQWLLVCGLCGLFWTFVWHPDLLERDWDLFSNVAFPLNVWAGVLLERGARGWPFGRGSAGSAVRPRLDVWTGPKI